MDLGSKDRGMSPSARRLGSVWLGLAWPGSYRNALHQSGMLNEENRKCLLLRLRCRMYYTCLCLRLHFAFNAGGSTNCDFFVVFLLNFWWRTQDTPRWSEPFPPPLPRLLTHISFSGVVLLFYQWRLFVVPACTSVAKKRTKDGSVYELCFVFFCALVCFGGSAPSPPPPFLP